MPIKLFVYRLRVNQYGLVSIKYIQDGYIKYAVFEKKYLDVNNGYNNSFNLGKRQYQSNLVMYVRSVHKDEIKTHDVKLIYYARAVDKKHIKHVNNDCHSFTSKHFEYDICNYNKSSKVLIITSDDYPDKVFLFYQNIPNKLFKVNAAYSSTIGNCLYNYPDPINASLEIGRRGFDVIILKKKNKEGVSSFYPEFNLSIMREEIRNQTAHLELNNWKELHTFLKNSKLKYRVSLDEASSPHQMFYRKFYSKKSKVIIN